MAYIGNDLQVAYQSYQIIDDISGSFNGSTTSFALLVGGVAPVPFPINEQQCLISVGGVIQEPDPTGTNGFKFSGGNIVFSSAPGTGEDFFGVILAGADYVNVGVNYPSGSESAPSITFDTDLDTGIYNPAANELGLVTNGNDAVRINSSGDVTINSDLTVDTDTLYVDSANDRVGIGTTSPGEELQIGSTSSTSSTLPVTLSLGGQYTPQASISLSNLKLKIYDASTDSSGFTAGQTGLSYVCGKNQQHIWYRADGAGTLFESFRSDGSGRLLVGTSSAFVDGFENAFKSSQLSKGGDTGLVRCISYTDEAVPVNNSTVDSWVARRANGNAFNQQLVGHFYIAVPGGVNAFSAVYSVIANSNGISDAVLNLISSETRGTSPVSSVQLANDGVSGAVKLTITYINNSGVVDPISKSYVTFVGLAG